LQNFSPGALWHVDDMKQADIGTSGQLDGRTEEQTDKRTDGRTDRQPSIAAAKWRRS